MKFDILKNFSWVVIASMLVSGCSSTKVANDFSGLNTTEGKPIAHLSTSNLALHLLVGKKPLIGDASLQKTVADFTTAAKAQGAKEVHVVQSSGRAWWFLFFPFTLVFTPVTSNVAGEAIA